MNKGKNAIVVGGFGGIGKSILSKFAMEGINVWALVRKVTDEDQEWIDAVSSSYGTWIKPVIADLCETDTIKTALLSIFKEGLPIDILINAAGISESNMLSMTTVESMKRSMEVNYIAPSFIMQMVARKMTAKRIKGVIVNIISRAALEVRIGAYAYGSSKAAFAWGTKAAAKELAAYGIRVNGIAPGITETKMGSMSRNEEEVMKYVEDNNIKRPAKPYEIADSVLFLVSDESAYISGQIISVDGGRD